MGASYKVAVIGAGTAGLVTARELQREGHRVTVFEKADKVGGTWLYNPRVETDPLGLDPNREKVHSSLYKSTRVNVPRQTMSFLDYPFEKREGGDPRTFPGHAEVLRFLQDFARDFGLMELIRFGHEVVRVELFDEVTHEWMVETRTREPDSTWESKEEIFEAVVICNGNFTEPIVAEFPGRDIWPGLQMHSHSYRTPEQFKNKTVVLIGNGPSSCRRHSEGTLLQNKFIKLLEHQVLASFVGLNYRVVIFKVMELQAKWVAKVLSGTVELPSREAMMSSVEELYSKMEKAGLPKHHTHSLQNDEVEYVSWLAAQLNLRLPKRWKEITLFSTILKGILENGDNYRDTWDADSWIQEIDSSD
ncbi:Flavin-containing monooxygenase FMO GS-OX-like 3 [Hibiscus syriacus]|uniref:Flavin-containing monooxygenase n=1 Tax=Hibiscus syriacus TaxID=106335 RepID=A0A6A3D531_HIBSY|nr:Flavin-containing monooxygenase FMO GS-OX-like 3 [Hibiscus syriacus]